MNTNMRPIALILILITPTWATAWNYNDDLTIKDLNPIYVSINDYAKNGCWTNIKEAKTYLSDKLELKGAVLTDDKNEVFNGNGTGFSLSVNAVRHTTGGFCYGTILVRTEAIGVKLKGSNYRGLLTFSEKSTIQVSPINFNENVLDVISGAIEEWR